MAVDYKRYKRYYTNLGPIMKSPVVRAYFAITLSVVVVAVFAAFAIRPTITTITSLVKKIDDFREVSRKLDEKINAIARLQSDYQRVEGDIKYVLEALPQSPQEPQAIIWLEGTATISGTTIRGVNISKIRHTASTEEKATSSGAITMPISFSGEGPYENVLAYLRFARNLPRIYSIRAIQMSAGQVVNDKTGKQGGVLPFRMEVDTYYLP